MLVPDAGALADDCIKAHLTSSGEPWAYRCACFCRAASSLCTARWGGLLPAPEPKVQPGIPKAGVELLEAALPNKGAV